MYIPSIFTKKRIGFKSKDAKEKYETEYKRLSTDVSNKLAPHIDNRQRSLEKGDVQEAEAAKREIIRIRAEYKNSIVDLNNKY